MTEQHSVASESKAADLRWSIIQRLTFIELRLFWEGVINRSDLVDRFAISVPQASTDLARYQELAPENILYDGSSKAYLASPNFEPRLIQPDARHYLTQLLMVADQGIATGASWLGTIPEHAVLPRVRRRLDAMTLRPVLHAIRLKQGLLVRYQSMNSPEPTARWIDPHALVFDGFRWHVRAWCYRRSRFCDFVLARVFEIQDRRAAGAVAAMDREWNEFVDVRLAPSPTLTQAQRRAVEHDYGMVDGEIAVSMRVCLTYYFEKYLGLDLDPSAFPPGRVQIIWVNRDEVHNVRATSDSEHSDR